mgnify:CR=1 FL=1
MKKAIVITHGLFMKKEVEEIFIIEFDSIND